MIRACDSCGTPLSGRRGHGFVTANGGLSCGRAKTKRTGTNGKGERALVEAKLPCARLAA